MPKKINEFWLKWFLLQNHFTNIENFDLIVVGPIDIVLEYSGELCKE